MKSLFLVLLMLLVKSTLSREVKGSQEKIESDEKVQI